MSKHPSHRTRFSDSSYYDEVCIYCGAHDEVPGGWGRLAKPCPEARDQHEISQDLHDLVKAHFNEPVLTDFQVGRIIGYSQDAMDCYMMIRYPNPTKVIHHTMVGGYYFLDRLKGQNLVISTQGEEWDDYFRIDNML